MHMNIPVSSSNQTSFRSKARAPGVVLALLSCLPIAGTLLVSQILPQMERAFSTTPHVRLQVSLALTIPALVIAITSWISGWIADRIGRRRLLVVALATYAIVGVLPIILSQLGLITVSRAAMGLAEALILTCSTALIGDMYPPGRREFFLSLQTSIASIAAVTFAILGGALGEFGWQAPFFVYAIALPFLAAVFWTVPASVDNPGQPRPLAERTTTNAFPLSALARICGVTVILSAGFYVAQIQLPFMLSDKGIASPGVIGMVSALTNVAVVVGTACFPLLRRIGLRNASMLCFLLLAVGLAVAGIAPTVTTLCAGLSLASFAGGMALPTLITSAMDLVEAEHRGLGTGMWQSSFWAGQFASPLLVVGITALAGTLGSAVMVFAGTSLATMLVLPWIFRSESQS